VHRLVTRTAAGIILKLCWLTTSLAKHMCGAGPVHALLHCIGTSPHVMQRTAARDKGRACCIAGCQTWPPAAPAATVSWLHAVALMRPLPKTQAHTRRCTPGLKAPTRLPPPLCVLHPAPRYPMPPGWLLATKKQPTPGDGSLTAWLHASSSGGSLLAQPLYQPQPGHPRAQSHHQPGVAPSRRRWAPVLAAQ
jgi:hypothetical protein